MAVLVRLFAIWLLVRCIDAFVNGVRLLSEGQSDSFISFGLLTVLAFFFLFQIYSSPLSVARLLVRNIGQIDNPTVHTSPEEWFKVGKCLLGLWFLGTALPDIGATIMPWVSGAKDPSLLEHLISPGLTSFIGVILLAGWPSMANKN